LDNILKYCKDNTYNRILRATAQTVYENYMKKYILYYVNLKYIDFITYFSMSNSLQDHAKNIYNNHYDCYCDSLDDERKIMYTHENVVDVCLSAFRYLTSNIKNFPKYNYMDDITTYMDNFLLYHYANCAIEIIRLPILTDEIYNILVEKLRTIFVGIVPDNRNVIMGSKNIIFDRLYQELNNSPKRIINFSGHIGTNFNQGTIGTRISLNDIFIRCINERPELFKDIYIQGYNQAILNSETANNAFPDSVITTLITNGFLFKQHFLPISIDVTYGFSTQPNFSALSAHKTIGLFAMVKLDTNRLKVWNKEPRKISFKRDPNLFNEENEREDPDLPMEYHVYYRYRDERRDEDEIDEEIM
jgi:hypothetical protein